MRIRVPGSSMGVICAMTAAIGGYSQPEPAQSSPRAYSDSVRIELRGTVPARCGLGSMPANMDFGGVTPGRGGLQREMRFRLDCNIPFFYELRAVHGAVRFGDGAVPNGFAAEFPYRATLTIPTNLGAPLTLSCSGKELAADRGTCRGHSGARIAIDKEASLILNWPQQEKVMAAGQYADQLQVVVGLGE